MRLRIALAVSLVSFSFGCSTERPCACIGTVESTSVSALCGESVCIDGTDFRCVDRDVLEPVGACGGDPDAGAMVAPDGGVVPRGDGGGTIDPPDAGPGPLSPCDPERGCAAGLRCATEYPRPFCVSDCRGGCSAGAVCVDGACVPSCRSGARDCDRFGGACLVGSGPAFCVPACEPARPTFRCDDATCDPYVGLCTDETSSGADVGEPCSADAECRSGVCFEEVSERGPTGYVGGSCVGLARYPGPARDGLPEPDGCPPGSRILDTGDLGVGNVAVCFRTCTAPDQCRPGYFCGQPRGLRIGYCVPVDCRAGDTCPAGSSCQDLPGGGRGCAPCTPQCDGRACGSDSCGGTCGSCEGETRCDSASGLCECVPELDRDLCVAAGATCGPLTTVDRCGQARSVVSCGSCRAPASCGALVPNQCACVGETDAALCSAAGATCGSLRVTDRCGVARDVACGGCEAPATCGGGGRANRCGCTPETNAAFCARLGATCGSVTAPDDCGTMRTVTCGACTAPSTCGGGGVANQCGCTGESDAVLCGASRTCGSFATVDRCGASRTVACGTCASGERCGTIGPSANTCVAPSPLPTAVCAANGACWETPFPTGADLHAVHRSASGTVWAVGAGGTVLRIDASGAARGWFALRDARFSSVWASSDRDVWVGGTNVMLHYDGTRWEDWTPPSLSSSSRDIDVWGAAPDDVWAAADGMFRFDGRTWTRSAGTTRSFRHVTGLSASSVYAIGGAESSFWAFDGASWTDVRTRSHRDLAPGTSGDVWLSTDPCVSGFTCPPWLSRYVGGSVRTVEVGVRNAPSVARVAALSDASVWMMATTATGRYFDGRDWIPTSVAGERVAEILGSDSGSGIATFVGERGGVYAAAGAPPLTRVTPARFPFDRLGATGTRISAAAPLGPDRIAVSMYVESPSLQVWVGIWDGREWSALRSFTSRVNAVCSEDGTTLWAFENDRVHQFDGTTWRTLPETLPNAAFACDGSSARDLWVSGYGFVARFDGTRWVASPNPLSGTRTWIDQLAAAAPDLVVALASDGTLMRWNGTSWSIASVPGGSRVRGITAVPGERTVIVAAEGGVFRSADGSEPWLALAGVPVAIGDRVGVWARRGDDVDVLSAGGALAHFDGRSWRVDPTWNAPLARYAWRVAGSSLWGVSRHDNGVFGVVRRR